MDQLLVNRGLAAEARELGLDKDPAVSRDLELAVEEVLAIHRLNRLLDSDNLPDFEPLARERYLADPSAYHRPESRVVEHVLISTSDRSDEEALQLAEQVREEAGVGASFLDLIVRYSDDPGKTNNQGRYTITDPTKYQPEFSAAAIGLSKPGDISAPIRTTFGYHIIKLVSVTTAETLPFERVREDLIRNIANEYRKNVRSDHLTQIRAKGEGQGDEELLLTLPYRYGGRTEAPGAGNSSGD
jgi:parvulin-like peptidyl-prolyl isomerase